MDFKNLNLRSIILIALAGLMFLGTIFLKMASHKPVPELNPLSPSSLESMPSSVSTRSNEVLPIVPINNTNTIKDLAPEDAQSIREMKEQMESDRLQQKKIKMLKLQLEQTNLQLEQEKALSEISKLEKENTGVVNDSNEGDQDKYPEIKVIYIGGTKDKKEAILSINGNNYSVKENNKPVKHVDVVSISNTGVVVHFDLPQELTSTIDYKPE